MKSRAWLVLGFALLVAAFLALRSFDRGDAARRSEGPRIVPERDSALRSDVVAPLAGDARADVGSDSSTSARPESAAAFEPEWNLTGRVVDPEGTPVGGAEVELSRTEAGHPTPRGIGEAPAERRTVARGASDADGRFTLRAARGPEYELAVAHAGFATARIARRMAGEDVLVRMERGATLSVRARRDDGPALADVALVLTQAQDGSRVPFEEPPVIARGITDALGRARFENLPLCGVRIDATPRDDAASTSQRTELVAGAASEVEIVLERGVTVRGRVRDATTRAPIAGARVGPDLLLEGRVARSDASGEYVFAGLPSGGHSALACDADGYGRASAPAREGANGPWKERVDFDLVPGRRAVGRVVDARGAPIAGARVVAYESQPGAELDAFDVRAARTGAEGRFEIADLRADVSHALGIADDVHARAYFEFPLDERQHDRIDFGDIAMEDGAVFAGLALDPARETGRAGAPRVRQALHVEFTPDAAGRYAGGKIVSPHHRARAFDTVCDDRGRFTLTNLPAGKVVIEADIPGVRDAPSLGLIVKRGEVRDDVRFVIDVGLSISGKVVDPDGNAIADVNVTVKDGDSAHASHANVRTGADGRFTSSGLTAGRHRLIVWPENRGGTEEEGTLFTNRVVDDVEAGRSDVVITLQRGRFLRGTVVDDAGQALARVYVSAKNTRGDPVTAVVSDAEGRFQLLLPPGEEFELEARPPATPGPSREAQARAPDPSEYARKRGVHAGDQGIVLRFP